jgi:hypothetical protein
MLGNSLKTTTSFIIGTNSMKTMAKIFLLIMAISSQSLWAFDDFLCQCRAQAPGYEETNARTGVVDKICSYSCGCLAWSAKVPPKTIKLDVIRVPTTAYSKEDWDTGSHICHGQYSWKPNLDAPNWKIKVKFDTFTLNSAGEVSYPENASREIANGINLIEFRHTKKATEISKSLKQQLKDLKP